MKRKEKTKKDKNILLESLCGAWSDVDDGIVDEIYNLRTSSDRKIDLD